MPPWCVWLQMYRYVCVRVCVYVCVRECTSVMGVCEVVFFLCVHMWICVCVTGVACVM